MSETTEPPAPWAPLSRSDFTQLLLRTGFSPEAYRDRYGDLAALNWDSSQALSHFLLFGLHERRVAPMTLDPQALIALARRTMHDTAFKARLLSSLGGHLFDATDHPYGAPIRQRWPVISALTQEGARPYFVAGDSHTNQYRLTGDKGADWLLPIHLLCTGGSAMGLGNPASRSGYGNHLRQAVQVIETLPGVERMPFLLQFGQVDIEFVHHFHRTRDGRVTLNLDDYRAFCDSTVEHYIRFVSQLFPPTSKLPVFLVSVFPPALSDAAWQQGYVNADIVLRETNRSIPEMSSAIQALEIADLRQRTEIHLYYNDLLRSTCKRHGFGFIDSATPFLGTDGIVAPRFVVPEANGTEHHLDDRVTDQVIRTLIWQCIDSAAGQAKP